MDGKVVIGAELETKSFDRQIEALKDKLDDLESQKIYFEAKGMTGELKDVEREIEVTKNKMIGLQKQKAKLEQRSSMGLSDALKQSSSQLDGIIAKVGKWALAVFSVRSAYNLVRQASSTLSQYNEQYATNLEYIRYVLAQTLAPVLEYIVNLAYKLLSVIGTMLNSLFGINIFSKVTADNFAKAKKNIGGANKTAKELQKTLTGFDEMNILNSTSTGGGGGVGASMPSMDLSAGIGQFANIGNITLDIMKLAGALLGVVTAIKLIGAGMAGIKAIGIGLMIYGVISLISDLTAYLQVGGDTFENFGKIVQDIGFIIVGLGAIIGSFPLIVAGAIVTVVGLVVKNWETIKGYLDKAIDWLDNAITNVSNFFADKADWVKEYFGIVGLAIWKILEKLVTNALYIVKGLIETIRNLLDGLFTGIKNIFDGILLIFKGKFKEGIISIGKGIVNILIGIINGITSGINTILTPIRDLIVEAGKILGKGWTMDNIKIPQIPLLATGAIVNMPGRGVPIGMAGERGQEGVIPLTDNQAMEALGQAIGRYITINASVTNTMNGRVISRELQKIKNVESFAFNG